MNETEMRERLVSLVAGYFENDAKKTKLWFKTYNPGLGNIAPNDMLLLNKTENLLNFVESQLAENVTDA
jgi:hypothetical protein